MSSFSYFYKLLCQPKVSPVATFEDIMEPHEERKEKLSLALPEEVKEEFTDSPFPSPAFLPILPSLTEDRCITSFQSKYDYATLYNAIYTILLPYDPYFDSYDYYWMIIDKRKKKHTSIKISLYQCAGNKILVECFSMNKDDLFWKIYHLLKNKCNNI